MNPFKLNTALDRDFVISCHEKVAKDLEACIKSGTNTVVLGAEGSGKTTLLNNLLDFDYRLSSALNEKILISPVVPFPQTITEDEVMKYFLESIIGTVKSLCSDDKNGILKELYDTCIKRKESSTTIEAQLFSVAELLVNESGYKVVLIIDAFENFLFSKMVKPVHHETLVDALKSTCHIIITNYDLNKHSLPEDARSSFYLSRFAPPDEPLRGMPFKETEDFILEVLKKDTITFSPELIKKIHALSGGLPYLVKQVSLFAYDYINENGTEEGIDFEEALYEEKIYTTLSHWCKMLTRGQINALKHLLVNPNDYMTHKFALAVLSKRGLLKPSKHLFDFCCELFKMFCAIDGNLEAAASKNPFNKEQETSSPPVQSARSFIVNELTEECNRVDAALDSAIAGIDAKYDSFINKLKGDRNSEHAKRLSGKLETLKALKNDIDDVNSFIAGILKAENDVVADTLKEKTENSLARIRDIILNNN